jgi:hypothetical protein
MEVSYLELNALAATAKPAPGAGIIMYRVA